MKKGIIYFLLLYFLSLLQTSFFAHFSVMGVSPNFILIAVVLINLLEKPQEKSGLAAGLFGGFFLDVFSLSGSFFFGFYTLTAVLISFFLKFFLKSYVQLPKVKRI